MNLINSGLIWTERGGGEVFPGNNILKKGSDTCFKDSRLRKSYLVTWPHAEYQEMELQDMLEYLVKL